MLIAASLGMVILKLPSSPLVGLPAPLHSSLV
jgi:hypothetical protein